MKIAGSFLTVAALVVVTLSSGVGCDTRWGLISEPSVALLVNDLPTPVRLRLCDSNDCSGFHPPDEVVKPAVTWQVNVSSVGVPNVYAVFGPGGERFGCLPLVSPHKRPEIRVAVSEHVPCRKEVDEERFWPARWEHMK
jgi:hypothetical protein